MHDVARCVCVCRRCARRGRCKVRWRGGCRVVWCGLPPVAAKMCSDPSCSARDSRAGAGFSQAGRPGIRGACGRDAVDGSVSGGAFCVWERCDEAMRERLKPCQSRLGLLSLLIALASVVDTKRREPAAENRISQSACMRTAGAAAALTGGWNPLWLELLGGCGDGNLTPGRALGQAPAHGLGASEIFDPWALYQTPSHNTHLIHTTHCISHRI